MAAMDNIECLNKVAQAKTVNAEFKRKTFLSLYNQHNFYVQ